MCGINGILSNSPLIDFDNQIRAMNTLLHHRGPDNQEYWLSDCKKVGFGHTRLSIIDISQLGNQPMKSASGRFVITFNGEIYNHKDLKNKYEIKCLGDSDTEVLLELIHKLGVDKTLHEIDGMFAFALWDNLNQTLSLCRDRFGEKPLYYGWVENKFVFSSQLDSLTTLPGFEKEIDKESLSYYQQYGYIPYPRSIYTNIRKLPPASSLSIVCNNLNFAEEEINRYWSLPENTIKVDNHKTLNDYLLEFDMLLKHSVESMMMSDVPLGAFLSGGTDSSLIVATMQALSSEKINTFTIGINNEYYNEAPLARDIAKHLGTNHTELYVDEKEIIELAPDIHNYFDEPFSDSSQIPTFLISSLAKNSVTVALSGDAGDEFFGGYKRYLTSRDLWKYSSILPSFARKIFSDSLQSRIISQSLTKLIPDSLLRKYSNPSNKLNKFRRLSNLINQDKLSDFYTILMSNNNSINFLKFEHENIENYFPSYDLDILPALMKSDIYSYLPNDILTKVDRSSMAHSLEVRVPFLNKDLAEWSFTLPMEYKIKGNNQKIFLKKYLEKYLKKDQIYNEKKGFSVPMNEWLKGPLKVWAEDVLNSQDFKESEFWDTKKVKDAWTEHKSGTADYSSLIWSILNFQEWKSK